MDYSRLCRAINYSFKQESHLSTALTHSSAGVPNNERLEFLGDALLSYIMAEALFERFPLASEGELTRLRATLVKQDTLAQIAQGLDLGHHLRLGGGELKSGGWQRASILADALEAIIGAIYLDTGMTACKSVVLRLWQEQLSHLSPHDLSKDPKTRLQELLQAKQYPLPNYQVISIKGAPHAQLFEVECIIPSLAQPAFGVGDSRRRAEQAAALQALNLLSHYDNK
jgi:ribonuclease-3